MTNRREFISLIASAAAYPVSALADQNRPMPCVGVLTGNLETDPLAQARVAAFKFALAQLGWGERDVRLVVRWPGPDIARQERDARELVAMRPDVILTTSTSATRAVRDATSTIPVVFVGLSDPVASGIVSNLARPDRNITGFMLYKHSLSGKWLGLLKEIAPQTTDMSILFNPDTSPYAAFLHSVCAGDERTSRSSGDDCQCTRSRRHRSSPPQDCSVRNGRCVGVTGRGLHRIKHFRDYRSRGRIKVPTIYSVKSYVVSGGLMSYSADLTNQFRDGASYVDRVLRGTRPNDLPVQFATKFDLVINVKVADVLGLTVPNSLLLDAELIE